MTFDLGPALLFCPADRPDRYAKAAERADAVILDLEDAVAPEDKAAAREALVAHRLDPASTIVRVNAVDSGHLAADLAAVARTEYRLLMLAKSESAEQVALLAGFEVIALCETAVGIVNVASIAAAAGVVAVMWGGEDLIASLGGTSSRHDDGRYRAVASHARSSMLLAAGAAGRAAIDSVYVDIPDLSGLALEVLDARGSGFTATACIHPSQVDVIRDAYRPTPEEVSLATAMLDAAEGERGVFRFDGKMVDEPVLRHARATLIRAGLAVRTPLVE
ncbi:CoA ester lyase [Frigoribacterium sp. CG_9.8]|uniref:HpcH/HpaI aldolase/citrate lyase family protein n=1 Tax=Frigoribacterium sp. CG_9.8 TaxID=2787733 RepID=UPI0018C903C3|nr:CoA ester lyase [Frigoribacterium sp. CG_9.8]MBG6107181.1 citrate lyase subunit beta/citryl-CoA lyase [Frigoribacterium sp. CG_9.8]